MNKEFFDDAIKNKEIMSRICSRLIEDKIVVILELQKMQTALPYRVGADAWYHFLVLIENLKKGLVRYDLLEIVLNSVDYVYSHDLNVGNFFDILKETLIKKNSDYGNSFEYLIKEYGWQYLAIELDKKKRRLHNLLKNKEKPNFESIDNNLLDIAGYVVLGMCVYEKNKYKNESVKTINIK